MTVLRLSHDLGLIGAAVVLCLVAAVGVFRIRWRMQGVRGAVRNVWLFLAAVTAGAGVWGVNCLLMVAHLSDTPVGYAPLATLVALVIATGGAHLSLAMAWSGRERLRQATGGVLLAFTVAGVHYTGVFAEHMRGTLRWEPILIWLSTAAGAVLAAAAMLAAGRARTAARQLAGGALLSCAVLALSLIGEAALTVAHDGPVPAPSGLLDHTAMLFIAGVVSPLMVGVGLAAAYIDDSTSRRALARLQRLADATRDGIAVLGPDRRILDCNAAFSGLCGLAVSEVRGRELWSLVTLDGEAESRLDQRQDGQVRCADGSASPVSVKLNFVADHGEDGRPGLIATLTDLREQRAAEARIRFLNEHDAVTGLPNRAALTDRLEKALGEAEPGGESALALVTVRVTNSQEVNALHGHAAGDALLAKVGERLARLAGGAHAAARLAGDEFAFFFPHPRRSDRDVEASAQRFFAQVTATLRRGFAWNALVLEPQVRIGVAVAPEDARTARELIMHADAALQSPDGEGEDGVFYFRKELHDALKAQRAMARDLRRAIDGDELVVFYQPQARAEDGALCGFEALVRWRHPELGLLSPDRFISVAESTGLIGALGEWVLRRACHDAAAWPRAVPVAVNLSALQVGDPDLPLRVHEILLETGLPPGRLELEVTESALFGDHQRALDILRRLKAMGMRIAMDDFGTGFSSLSTLQSFPFDKIKIDKSFVQGVGVLERSTVIVKAVLGIGRGLEIPVVAEGVETSDQMRFLREEKCATVQGYHIGRPGPVELHARLFETAPDERPRRPAPAEAAVAA